MSKSAKQASLNSYLNDKVSFIFERLIVEILASRPSDVIDWAMKWLDTKGRQLVKSQSTVSQQDKKGQASQHTRKASSGEEDSEDDYVDVLPINKKKTTQGRASVSAEVFGSFNKKQDFKPRVIHKGNDQKQRITVRLLQSFMFQNLEDKEREIVLDAMEEKKFIPGDTIIKQGDDGDNLYVVDQGELDCFKQFGKDASETYLKTYKPGESFGELALLYNAPRAATIRAKTNAVLFALDRPTFNNIVKDSAVRKRNHYESVLKKIDLLSSMDPYETTQVCDGIQIMRVQKGEQVIKQGDKGDKFFMVEEGSLIATKSFNDGREAQQVFEYKPGDYFGEIALLKDVPRQANVVAVTDAKLVYLEQAAFKRLLGPVEVILQRNSDRYKKYISE